MKYVSEAFPNLMVVGITTTQGIVQETWELFMHTPNPHLPIIVHCLASRMVAHALVTSPRKRPLRSLSKMKHISNVKNLDPILNTPTNRQFENP